MEIITKKQFEKDIKRLQKRQKDFSKLERVLNSIVSGKMLEKKLKNHPLVGDWKPCWKLHIEPDWLLIYSVEQEKNNAQGNQANETIFA